MTTPIIANAASLFTRAVHEVARSYDVSPLALLGKRRPEHLANARKCLYWLGYEVIGLSSTQVGELMGGRDHGTVLHGVRAFHDAMDTCHKSQDIADHFRRRFEPNNPEV